MQRDWIPINVPPSEACAVWLLQKCGKEEMGFYREIMRKDGMQFVFLGADTWMVGWRSGENACISWCPREYE